ncbi:WD repeat-containing protein 5 [Exophiala dermatitidis]
MDQDQYRPSKRRRTSSAGSMASTRSSYDPEVRPNPESTASRQDDRRGGTHNRSQYRGEDNEDKDRDSSPRRKVSRGRNTTRSRSPRRRFSRSRTSSSRYDSAPEHQRGRSHSHSHSRSRARRRTRSRSRSDSRSYSPSYNGSRSRSRSREGRRRSRSATASKKPKTKPLNFVPLITIPRAHARGITSIKFSPDMTLLATASADNTINIYSVPADPKPDTPFKLLRTLRAHLAGVNAIAWSPVGPPYTLASASDDKSILLWSPLSSDFPISPSPLIGHHNYVYSLAFSPKGNMLVSGSYDEAVFLWDVRPGRVMRSLPAHSDPVSGVDFLRDGTMVCSCAGDGLIRIWDSSSGQCLKTLVDEARRPVTGVRFTPNGKYILAWTLDNSIRLWRYSEGTCVKTYQGHVNQEYSLGGTVGSYYSSEGQGSGTMEAFLASGSEDGDVLVWDISSKDVLWRGKGHRDVVLSVDFGRTKAGKGLLVSGGKDRDLRVWILEGEPKPDQKSYHYQQRGSDEMDPNMGMELDGDVNMNGEPEADLNHDGDEGRRQTLAENGSAMDLDVSTPIS